MLHVHCPAAWGMHDCTLSHTVPISPGCMHVITFSPRHTAYTSSYALSHMIFPTFWGPLYAWGGAQGHSGRALLGTASVGSVLQGPLACDAHATQAPAFASHVYRHPHSDAQLSISRSRVHVCLQALPECLRMCLDPTVVSASFSTLVETASPCSTSGIPYERTLHSLHGVLCARSRPTAQLSSAQCTQLQITSAVGFSPSAQMQQTASIPTAHHSPFGLCLLLVLLLLAVATYSDYFTLTSVHVCLSCSSGVLYRSSNADYVGESSPLCISV